MDWNKIKDTARYEFGELVTINPSSRPWQMPFAAALASGLPLFFGAALDRVADGVVGSLAGLAFLYLPNTSMHHRMVTLMACCFGMIASFAIGMSSHLAPAATIPIVTACAILATFVCRYYRVGVPGSLFFIMVALIGAYLPIEPADIPAKAGLMAIGCVNATFIAFLYSLFILRRQNPTPAPLPPAATFELVWFDSFMIGLFVGLSLVVAQLLHLEKPYWVAMSCLAIIQGLSLRAAWTRQVHRIVGTTIGLGVAFVILLLVKDGWTIAISITLLTFMVETAIVRHYGFAAILFTPLALLLAEAPTLGHADVAALTAARFFDTLIGAFMGFLGAMCLHNPTFRARAGALLRRIIPEQFISDPAD